MSEKIDKLLTAFGLNHKERLIIKAMMKGEEVNADTLSRRTDLPRTTIYSIADGLVKRGILSINKKGRAVRFYIRGHKAFESAILQEEEQISVRRQTARDLSQILEDSLEIGAATGPRVASAEGRREVEQLLYEFLPRWQLSYKRINHFVMWGYQDHSFVEHYRSWHEYAWEVRDPREEIRLFSNPEGIAQQRGDKIAKRELRLLPAGIKLSSSLWIHGEYVLLGVSGVKNNTDDSGDTHRATIVYDPLLAENLRGLFRWVWQLSG